MFILIFTNDSNGYELRFLFTNVSNGQLDEQ